MYWKPLPKIAAREICFYLYRGDIAVLEGRFVVTAATGVSTFGAYKEFAFVTLDRPLALYEGAALEHSLKSDGAALISLDYYSVVKDENAVLGYSQVHDLDAKLVMGANSGSKEYESVALGDEYALAFRSHRIA